MKRIAAVLFLFLPVIGFAQEYIRPATAVTQRYMQPVKTSPQYTEGKGGASLSLPFVDDFSNDRFVGNAAGNTVLWTDRRAVRNDGLAVNPPTVGVVSFDGTDENGLPYDFSSGSGPADTLTSAPINLNYTADDEVGLSFYFQPKGNGFFAPATPNDSLILEFYAPETEQWARVWATIDVTDPENFTFVYVPIVDEIYLKDGFRFRFRNIAYLQGVFSVWNVDYVWLDLNGVNAEPVNNDVAFVRPEHTLLQDYTAMPLSHFAQDPAGHMRTDITVLLRNLNDGPRTLEGNKIRILHEGNVVADLPNSNSPAIQAGQTLEYTHKVFADPNNFVYDPSLADEHLVFDVEILHGVSDFQPTSSNDTLKFQQSFYTHYAYDDGSAEAGYGVSGNGSRAALKYINYKTDSIWALQIYTMPYGINYSGTTFTIMLWEDAGGVPGAEIAEASQVIHYGSEGYQESIIYQFDEPVFMPSGSYFAGYRQSNQSQGITIGLDFNTRGNVDRLLFNDGNGWAGTILASQASLMIRPMFTTEGYEDLVTDVRDRRPENVSVYPNPASSEIHIDLKKEGSAQVVVYDLQGRLVLSQTVMAQGDLNVSQLPEGMYVLRVERSGGVPAVAKFAIAR